MCVFSAVYRVLPDCPIFLLTNRDESTERPSLSPQRHGTSIFGPADARAGGTWLGVNSHGLIAAVTNRKKTVAPINPRSRGLLCRDALGQAAAAAAADWVLGELSRHEYAGFNLILLGAESACVIEAADETRVTPLAPGIHTVANSAYAAQDDPRKNAVQELVEQMVREETAPQSLIERAKEICRIHSSPGSPGICLHGENWGTVGSTIIALTSDRQKSEFHYAAGPPCRTLYIDYSQEFRASGRW